LYDYLNTYSLELSSNYDGILGKHVKKPWSKFVTPENKALANNEALDLVNKMLVYDHVIYHLNYFLMFTFAASNNCSTNTILFNYRHRELLLKRPCCIPTSTLSYNITRQTQQSLLKLAIQVEK